MPISQPFSGAKRVAFVQPCHVAAGGAEAEGTIRNISVLGVYLAVEPIPKAGEALRLRFDLPEGAGTVEVDAEVAWRNTPQRRKVPSLPPGCGLRFIDLGDRDRRRLEALVTSLAPKRD